MSNGSNGTPFRIRTSHLQHEILLASVNRFAKPDMNAADLAAQAMEGAYQQTADSMKRRCPSAIKFWKMDFATNGVECTSCSLNPKLNLSETHPGLRDFSTFPEKSARCCEQLLDVDCKSNVLITFGKFDTLIVAPVYHSYWSAYFRALVARNQSLGEFISIPASRVSYPEINMEGYDNDLLASNRQAGRPLVIWTLISYPQVGKGIVGERSIDRRQWLEETIRWLQEIQKAARKGELQRGLSGCRLEIFLSYSTLFPLIVKAEFNYFEEIEGYWDLIRSQKVRVGATSSIISIRSNAIWDPNGHLKDKSQPLTKKNLAFSLLLKVFPGTDAAVRKVLKIELPAALNAKDSNDINFVVSNRAYYWDLHISLQTREVEKLINYVAEFIGSGKLGKYPGCWPNQGWNPGDLSKAVERAATIPYWPIDDTEPKEFGIKPDTVGPLGTLPDCFQEFGKYQGQTWGGDVGLFDENTPGIIARRLYNLKFALDWVFCHVAQLQDAWHRRHLPGQETFDRVVKTLNSQIVRIKKLGTRLEDLGPVLGTDPIPDDGKKGLAELWAELADCEWILKQLKEHTYCLRAEFHERTEGLQAVTNTEPHIIFGERSGVSDLFHVSAAVLLRRYCGQWDFSGKGEFKDNLWNGVVASSNTALDWIVFPEVQILRLPLELKLGAHAMLLPLAHEASHQILAEAATTFSLDEGGIYLAKWWSTLCTKAKELLDELQIIVSGTMSSREIPPTMRYLVQQEFKWVFRELRAATRDGLGKSELLADVLYFLSGGPAAVSSIFELVYSPTDRYRAAHPPTWMRVFLGCRLLAGFGVNLKEDPWLVLPIIRKRIFLNTRRLLEFSHCDSFSV